MTQVTTDKVAETSTSTGTGDMVLAGALTGYSAFSSVCVDTNTVPYHICAVDAGGNPTGDWETGVGVYNSTANSITRLGVSKSSNANALVNFSAGTKRIELVLLSSQMYTEKGVPFKSLESLSPGFDAQYFWGFSNNAEGWTSSNAAGTVAFDSSNGRGLLVTDVSTTTNFQVRSPSGLSINGSKYRRVKISVTIITSASFAELAGINFQYVTAGHSFSATYRKLISPPPYLQPGDTIIYDCDMETAEGAPDWQTNTITQIQMQLTPLSTSGTVLRINWIAVGSNRPARGSNKKMRMVGLR